MKHWPFAKYVGCGNDFILFDNRDKSFPISPPLIRRLCQRQQGIGADGLLLLENSSIADFCMRIFNSDGNEAEMCGNGMRCFVKWLASIGFKNKTYRIEVMQDILKAAHLNDDDVVIEMGSPRNIQWNISLRFQNQFLRIHYLHTGVPHAVIFMKEIENIDLAELGSYIRHYSLWQPNGTNVNLVQQISCQKLKIRTYERGIEGETLACGTGTVAAALAAAYQFNVSSPLKMETRSKEELTVHFSFENQKFSNVTLTGPAKCLFLGDIRLPNKEWVSSNDLFDCF